MARAWQRMLSGRRLNLLDPSPMDVEIEDIAHGLAFVARWNGQTLGDWPFSVAQHCVVVEKLVVELNPKVTAADRLEALLHDGPEYVIGDMISPFKSAIGTGYKTIEENIARAIRLRFGLPVEPSSQLSKLIKKADHACAYFEAVQLAGFDTAEAEKLFGAPKVHKDLTIQTLPPAQARDEFLKRFKMLTKAMEQGG